MRIAAGLVGLMALGACEGVTWDTPLAAIKAPDLLAETRRAMDETIRDLPFDSGRVYVVANEHGDLHTYSLTPCRGGTRICGGTGGVGRVERLPDFYMVTGAYPERTFFLAPGGDGVLRLRGVDRELAWN